MTQFYEVDVFVNGERLSVPRVRAKSGNAAASNVLRRISRDLLSKSGDADDFSAMLIEIKSVCVAGDPKVVYSWREHEMREIEEGEVVPSGSKVLLKKGLKYWVLGTTPIKKRARRVGRTYIVSTSRDRGPRQTIRWTGNAGYTYEVDRRNVLLVTGIKKQKQK